MKKDRYLRARGGVARMLDVHCSNCDSLVLTYQKDGVGNLLRCYLNRIFAPAELAALQSVSHIKAPKDFQNLQCPSCSAVIGSPMCHVDGRLAFRLIKGTFSKKLQKGKEP